MTRKRCLSTWPAERRRSPLVRVKAPRMLLFVWAALFLWDPMGLVRISMLCALLHESGHAVAYTLMAGRPPCFVVSVAGICLELRGAAFSRRQLVLLAAAGPMVNFLLCIAACLCMGRVFAYSYGGYRFSAANLLLGLFNLLPVPGLDGACILENLRG